MRVSSGKQKLRPTEFQYLVEQIPSVRRNTKDRCQYSCFLEKSHAQEMVLINTATFAVDLDVTPASLDQLVSEIYVPCDRVDPGLWHQLFFVEYLASPAGRFF